MAFCDSAGISERANLAFAGAGNHSSATSAQGLAGEGLGKTRVISAELSPSPLKLSPSPVGVPGACGRAAIIATAVFLPGKGEEQSDPASSEDKRKLANERRTEILIDKGPFV